LVSRSIKLKVLLCYNSQRFDYEKIFIQKSDNNFIADIDFSSAAILSGRDSGLFQIVVTYSALC